MVRSVFSKVMWVGRATVFLVGLAVILALIFGVLSRATAHTGSAGLFHLNHNNPVTTTLTKLTGTLAGPVLRLDNNSTATGATALNLQVESGKAPLSVNASAGTATGLSADEVDGMNSSALVEPRGYAQVTTSDPFFASGSSKGVIDIDRTTGNAYCFQLSFVPKTAIASAHLNNNATVGTAVGSSNAIDQKCGAAGNYEAAAITYGANDPNSTPSNQINFGIVFM